ncbi:hypothetical protein SRHO_G00345000 [Serrasalmus rhombeus]
MLNYLWLCEAFTFISLFRAPFVSCRYESAVDGCGYVPLRRGVCGAAALRALRLSETVRLTLLPRKFQVSHCCPMPVTTDIFSTELENCSL